MLKQTIALCLLAPALFAGTWRIDGADTENRYRLSLGAGTFYTDGFINSSAVPTESEYFAYYTMDDNANTTIVLDSSGNGRNTVHPSGNTAGYSSEGLKGSALWTAIGSGGFPIHSSISTVMDGDFSMAAWINLDCAEPNTAIFFSPAAGNNCFAMIKHVDGLMLCKFGGDGASYSVNVFPTWHHIVFVKSNSAVTVHYDGVGLGSVEAGGAYSTAWTLFDAGMSGYNQTISDEVIFYNTALTQEKVTELYESYEARPQFATVTYDAGYFVSDMGLSGACSLSFASKTVLVGGTIGVFPTITRNDPRYVFGGWKDNTGAEVTESADYSISEVHANWNNNRTSGFITFDYDGGSGPMPNSWSLYEGFAMEQPYLGNYFPTGVTQTGYDFNGWFTDYDGAGIQITTDKLSNSTEWNGGAVYAYWTLTPITMYFDVSYATPVLSASYAEYASASYTPGASGMSLPSAYPGCPGYYWTGYWIDSYSTQYDSNSMVPYESTTLWPVWAQTGGNGSLTFNLQGGYGDTPTITLYDGWSFGSGPLNGNEFPANPTDMSYTFVGWNTSADGSGTWIEASTIYDGATWSYSGLEIFAIWY